MDVESPSQDEVTMLVKKYELHPLVGEELLSTTRNSKVEIYKDYIFLAIHVPIRTKVNGGYVVVKKEVDFVIGNKFIITSRKEVVEPLHNFARVFETNSILDKNTIGHAGLIFYYMMKKIYGHMNEDLENIKDSLTYVENKIFLGHERKMVEVLSELSRELIDFKQATRLHGDVLESFHEVPKEFFGKDFEVLMDNIRGEYESAHSLVVNNRDLLNELRDTNDSLLSTKQNEHLKLFSILAFLTFPLMLFLNIFMLPTEHTPIIGWRYDWQIIFVLMLLGAGGMLYFFKRKGWL